MTTKRTLISLKKQIKKLENELHKYECDLFKKEYNKFIKSKPTGCWFEIGELSGSGETFLFNCNTFAKIDLIEKKKDCCNINITYLKISEEERKYYAWKDHLYFSKPNDFKRLIKCDADILGNKIKELVKLDLYSLGLLKDKEN